MLDGASLDPQGCGSWYVEVLWEDVELAIVSQDFPRLA